MIPELQSLRVHCPKISVYGSQLIVNLAGTSGSQRQRHKVTVTEVEDEDAPASSTANDAYSSSDKEPCELSTESEASKPDQGTSSKRKKSQRCKKSKERKRQKKNYGSIEVEVMDIDTPILSVHRDKSKDVDRFFSPAYTEGGKRMCNCCKCRYTMLLYIQCFSCLIYRSQLR